MPSADERTSRPARAPERAPHVLLFYRNRFAAPANALASVPQCHIGLGVNALHTTRVLRRLGVPTYPYGVWTAGDVRARLREHPAATHAVLEAPWVPRDETEALLAAYPKVHVVVRCHSQIGFLQVEAGAITLLRNLLLLQESVLNLSVAGNSPRFTRFVERAYGGRCLDLPNLYDAERPPAAGRPPLRGEGRPSRVGSSGAMRLLKNHTTSAAAALLAARALWRELACWVSVDGGEYGGMSIVDALRAMFAGLPWATLVEQPWQDWPAFRRTVGHMDLCLQLSHTETFHLTTADAVAEGVPCVVSPAIEGAPNAWKVDSDRPEDAARVALGLLASDEAPAEGKGALERFVRRAGLPWLAFLGRLTDPDALALLGEDGGRGSLGPVAALRAATRRAVGRELPRDGPRHRRSGRRGRAALPGARRAPPRRRPARGGRLPREPLPARRGRRRGPLVRPLPAPAGGRLERRPGHRRPARSPACARRCARAAPAPRPSGSPRTPRAAATAASRLRAPARGSAGRSSPGTRRPGPFGARRERPRARRCRHRPRRPLSRAKRRGAPRRALPRRQRGDAPARARGRGARRGARRHPGARGVAGEHGRCIGGAGPFLEVDDATSFVRSCHPSPPAGRPRRSAPAPRGPPMSRFTGPRVKAMRAVGVDLPGLSRKSIERRPYPPGQHGQAR
ncbi:MAG TPA: hypothetical protein VFS43_37320, partial [Polyangiaceae bacterium]|nr:hypothetical protein [Polyangiaceae bacterium]